MFQKITRPRYVLILLVLSFFVSLCDAKVVLKEFRDGRKTIHSSGIRAEFDTKGNLSALSRIGKSGRVKWKLQQRPGANFWGLSVLTAERKKFSLKGPKKVAVRAGQDSLGAFVESVWNDPAVKMRFTVIYRVNELEQDRLRANYVVENGGDKDHRVRVFFSTLGNYEVGEDKWVVYPYRSGKLMRSDKIKAGEQPAPGHMWMQFMGYYDQAKKSGLIMYPEDRTGYLKFAYYSPSNGLTLSWRMDHFIRAGQRYINRFDYVIRPLATPNNFNEICYAYGEWARKQGWMVTASQKMKKRPVLKQMAREGVVKIEGRGGLPRAMSRGKFFPLEQKDKIVSATTFEKNLEKIHKLEKKYGIKPVYRFDGWWDRFDSRYPFILPINKKLGGNEGFKRFCKINKKEGRTVVLHANPIQYDVEMAGYNDKHMMKTREGKNSFVSIWSGNKLVTPSPRFALPDNLKMLFQIQKWGATGVFWDVIGASAPHYDFNPAANYPNYMEDDVCQEYISLMAALRDSAPEMIFGTEDGQEQMLPYYDYAPVYFNYGDNKTLTWAPLNELVYGDAFFNTVGIDGNNQPFNDARRVSRRLFGAILGHDSRQPWVKNYEPVTQQIFEVNRVIGCVATERMQKHIIDPKGWRASFWKNAVVIGNVASESNVDVVINDTPLGKVEVSKIRHHGFAIVTDEDNWVAWGIGELKLNGKTIVSCSNPDSVIVKNSKGITLATYGFYNTSRWPEYTFDSTDWKIICKEMIGKKMIAHPSDKIVKVKTEGDSIIVPVPGAKQVYRIR